VWISRNLGCSALLRKAFHGNDKSGVCEGGNPISRNGLAFRKGSTRLITSFWGFIHSLFLVRIRALKRVIITGGTGGLGMAISGIFRDAGWEVAALGSKDLNLEDSSAVEAYFSENQCDLLVCAAGGILDQPLARMAEESWNAVYGLNFVGARLCALAVLPGMVSRGGGHVVFVSSYAALHPAVGQAAYATAKAALLGLTKDLAEAWGGKGIRVNTILPGFLDTAMTAMVSEKRRETVKDLHFLGEFNTPVAAAEFVRFLEERMLWTSGQVFQLDSRP